VPWGAAVAGVAGAAGSIIGGASQAKAIKGAQKLANDYQREAREVARGDFAPYRLQGENALKQVGALSGANGLEQQTNAMAAFTNSPTYQWQKQEGLAAVDAGAASRGLLRSGATLRAEQTLGNNLAQQGFQTYYNNLLGLAQIGQASAAGSASASMQSGAGMAQTAASAGGALASIYGNMASGVGNSIQQGIQNYQYAKQNPLMQPSATPAATTPTYTTTPATQTGSTGRLAGPV
jgi:hypothetical protein